MKYYEKFQNHFSADSLEIPKLGMQIVETECFHCGQKTRFPVQQEYVDWERVAETYRQGYENIMKRMDQMMRDLDVMYPSNPVRDYIANEWRSMLGDVEDKF